MVYQRYMKMSCNYCKISYYLEIAWQKIEKQKYDGVHDALLAYFY